MFNLGNNIVVQRCGADTGFTSNANLPVSLCVSQDLQSTYIHSLHYVFNGCGRPFARSVRLFFQLPCYTSNPLLDAVHLHKVLRPLPLLSNLLSMLQQGRAAVAVDRERDRFQSSLSISLPVRPLHNITYKFCSYRDVAEVAVLEAEVVDLQEVELLADLVEEDAAWGLVL